MAPWPRRAPALPGAALFGPCSLTNSNWFFFSPRTARPIASMSDDGRSDDGWGRACKLDFASAPRTCAHPPHAGAPAELAAQRPQALEQRHACIPPLSRARLAPDAAPRGAAAVPLRPYAARTIARGQVAATVVSRRRQARGAAGLRQPSLTHARAAFLVPTAWRRSPKWRKKRKTCRRKTWARTEA